MEAINEYPFNGSSDPVYQDVMGRQAVKVAQALALLREVLDTLDSAEETAAHAEGLRPVAEDLYTVASEEFEITE